MKGVLKIKLEIDTLKSESKDLLDDVLNDQELLNKLNEVLQEEKTSLNISLEDKDVIRIKENKIALDNGKKEKIEENSKKISKTTKFIKSFYKVFESFFDSIAKAFLKKKYKVNNSVYNDGKKAIIAACQKDTKTFFKKASDSILNLFKKIPAETRKIIKNTKNVAIDEIYSWKLE